jgi:large subunit ribosomal protein L10
MKKLGLLFKEASENRITKYLTESNAVFIIKYLRVSSPDMSALRQSLRSSSSSLFVVKNSVARRALASSGREALLKSVDGPCGFVFVKEEPVAASKALVDFLKTHEQLKIEGGFLQDKILAFKDIETLAKLPSREVLLGQVVSALNAPIANFVTTLHQTLSKFVICLDQIRQKKTSSS